MTNAGARQREEKEYWVFSGKTCTPVALYKRIFKLFAHDHKMLPVLMKILLV